MYNYQTERAKLFTEQGQVAFIKARDRVKQLLRESGAFMMDKILSVGRFSDTWQALACVDRMVELGEIRELTDDKVAGQHRVFISTSSRL